MKYESTEQSCLFKKPGDEVASYLPSQNHLYFSSTVTLIKKDCICKNISFKDSLLIINRLFTVYYKFTPAHLPMLLCSL